MSAATGLVHWDRVLVSLKREPELYVPDPELGFRHPPNSRWSGRPRSDIPIASGLRASTSDRLTITYDSRGYRNATPLSRADIVLIGDEVYDRLAEANRDDILLWETVRDAAARTSQ